jgi:mannitol-1-phosphate 5-dehydrogenase
MWEMPADKSAFVGPIPEVQGLDLKEGFRAGVVRKLFTYNAINAVVCYTGYLRGYRLLSEAANDPELARLAQTAGEEASAAICRQYGFDPEEQRLFAEAALAKYQSVEIIDPIERNARDPLRKLGRYDRLVGPACLAIEHGIQPIALSKGIAAALHYDYPGDPLAAELQEMIAEMGLPAVIEKVCGLDPAGIPANLILVAWESIRAESFFEENPGAATNQ